MSSRRAVSYTHLDVYKRQYYKCADDWNDERKLSRWALSKILKRKCAKVKKKYPEKAEFIESRLNMLSIVESSKVTHIDRAARVFGEIMAEVFVYKDDMWKEDLYKIGFYLGKYIYLLDAYEDIEKDIKSGAYNPFKEIYHNDDLDVYKRQQQVYPAYRK